MRYLGVETGVLSCSCQILGRECDTNALHRGFLYQIGGEIVCQGEVLQTQVTAILYIAIADASVLVRVTIDGTRHGLGRVLRCPTIQHLVGLVVCSEHTGQVDVIRIVNLSAGNTLQVERELQTELESEGIGHREHPVRIRVTEYRTVLIVDDTIVVQVAEADITYFSTGLNSMFIYFILILENTIGHKTIEAVDRLACLQNSYIRVTNLVDVFRSRTVQVEDSIAIPSHADIGLPGQDVALDIEAVERQLQTRVEHLTGIGIGHTRVLKSGGDRHTGLHEHVCGLLVVPVQTQI